MGSLLVGLEVWKIRYLSWLVTLFIYEEFYEEVIRVICFRIRRKGIAMKTAKELFKSDVFKTLIMNLAYFVFFTVFLFPYFEENDDASLSCIVSGAYGEASPYMIYTNIIIGKILSRLTYFFPMIKWYIVFTYFVLFISFCFLTYVIIKKCGQFGYYVSVVILTYFGYECYVAIQYTKTAGLATIAGILLILYVLDSKKWNWVLLTSGSLLVICGSMIRFESFGMVLILMSIAVAVILLEKVIGSKSNIKDIIIEYVKCALVFIAVFLVVAGLKYIDYHAYNSAPEWRAYREFNEKRTLLLDYGMPDFSECAEEYLQIGVTENDFLLMRNWVFDDPAYYNLSLMEKMLLIKDTHKKAFGFTDVKRFFVDTAKLFAVEKTFCAFLIIILFWLIMSRKKWGVVLCTLLLIIGLNIYLQYSGRVLLNRVDVIIWLAVSFIIIYTAGNCVTDLNFKKNFSILIGMLIIINGNNYLAHIDEQKVIAEQKQRQKEFCEEVILDETHLYLVDTSSNIVTNAYQVFDSIPVGIYKNYYTLGGWETYSPTKLKVLDLYGVKNPFKDIVNNKSVYLIDNCDRIDGKVTYIREHYAANAQAALIKQFGENDIYTVFSNELNVDVSNAISDSQDLFHYVSLSEDGDNVTVDGTVYMPGDNSFQDNIYLMLKDRDNGNVKYLYTCQKESSSRGDVYNGRYSNFTGTFNKTELGMDNYEVQVILESSVEKYLVGVDDIM